MHFLRKKRVMFNRFCFCPIALFSSRPIRLALRQNKRVLVHLHNRVYIERVARLVSAHIGRCNTHTHTHSMISVM